MKFEDQFVELPLAKRLKELGVKQESLFHWRKNDGDWDIWRFGEPTPPALIQHIISAFTVAELGEMLPWNCWTQRTADESKAGRVWNCFRKTGEEYFSQAGITEADARAKMLIYLIENKLVKV